MSTTVKVKICGITQKNDAELAIQHGAWAIGFIFHSASPRVIEVSRAREIVKALSNANVKWVGVFVDPTLEYLEEVVNSARINAIQLHGSESAGFCRQVKKNFPQLTVIKAVRLDQSVKGNASLFSECDFQLIDSAQGGSGKTVDWKKAAEVKGKPVILAGGLTPENVIEAIKVVRPFAVDVSSGVEQSPGIKSEQKLIEFLERVSSI